MAQKGPRIQMLIKKNIMDIIMFELENPLMKLTSVNDVVVNKDHSLAKVYISSLDRSRNDEALKILNDNKGFIRSSLASKMDIYKVPEIAFFKDDLVDKYEKIDNILKELKINDEK